MLRLLAQRDRGDARHLLARAQLPRHRARLARERVVAALLVVELLEVVHNAHQARAEPAGFHALLLARSLSIASIKTLAGSHSCRFYSRRAPRSPRSRAPAPCRCAEPSAAATAPAVLRDLSGAAKVDEVEGDGDGLGVKVGDGLARHTEKMSDLLSARLGG